MKFKGKLHKIVNNNQHHFCKDPSTHPRTRSINVRAHVLSRVRTFCRARARLCLVCAHVCMDLYEKSFGYCLLSYEIKFQIS